ncbi:single-stranded DNA-binding protein WHY1, chloroplastic-like [Macadamia integrifolia]|uniref:single-stranded DNA-binding protein WHY1, chloroplastic-like n=1 Tax=Macadamia integrifolia TaxID=60698 RepID=UPI001C4F7643|nr:single-stranded DNA-binding protein WHY1, chloroplastic-like [Macadamia integrifolia]XP_042502349.1 single-stranded DNA-binding protein WHY1, chloroplastic-like [Macadamia integrifolia]
MNLLQSPTSSSTSVPLRSPKFPPVFSHTPAFLRNCSFAPSFSRVSRRKLSVECRRSEYFEQHQRFNGPADDSSPQSTGALPPRVFVGHSIYKGKAALTVEPKAPEFAPLDSGAFKLTREGFVILQFAPAVGVRQYDWSRKQVFSLSVTEIGTLISLGARDSCEFFHDPFKGKSEEGKVRKVLKVEPLPDGSGHFFNLSVQNRISNVDENIYIPITKAEFTVLVSAFNFILPYLLGWHAFVNSIKPDDPARINNANPRYGTDAADLEWSR